MSFSVDGPQAVPIDLEKNYAKYHLAGLRCFALATSLQLASAMTKMYDTNGVLSIRSWGFGLAMAATACHFVSYLLALYSWCRALKLNDARVLAWYRVGEKDAAVA